jgi:hypothetical protein
MSVAFACPGCHAPLPTDVLNAPELRQCPGCHTRLQVHVFPARFRPPATGGAGERILAESEASCFYHPEKRAAVPCDACGRFLCALCDCELQGQHLCPHCLQTGRDQGRLSRLETTRVRYDNVALSLAVLPLLVFYLTVVTAPMTVYLVIRHWKTPLSILPCTRIRFVCALMLALLQIGGWIVAGYLVVRGLSG